MARKSALIFSLIFLPGCELTSFWSDVARDWNALPRFWLGPRARQKPEMASQARENAELLQEIYRVALLKAPEDRRAFTTYLDIINQGASFEGIHNGFTHSMEYRKLELSQPASQAAFEIFNHEIVAIEGSAKIPKIITVEDTAPLPLPVDPAMPEIKPTPKPSPSGLPGIFTLKRVLCEEISRVFAEKMADPKALASWYAQTVERQSGYGVDFGLPARNRRDLAFHESWAKGSDPDRVLWEMLNRAHRILNFYQIKGERK